jgi:NTP pyrophosphatase (non-canonical NTP hydrolase)
MYSQLSDAEIERLAKLAEECGEVVQVIGKILIHGWDSYHPRDPEKITNRAHLEEEIGNIGCIVALMSDETRGDLSFANIEKSAIEKRQTIGKYLHHQEGL